MASYPAYQDPQGFPMSAQNFLRTYSPPDANPGFKAKIPTDGIHAGQYSYFEWGAKPDSTPKSELRVTANDVIAKPIDGFGRRVTRYIKLLRQFTLKNKIYQALLNEKKKTVGVANALQKRMMVAEAVRSLRNEVAGMTKEEAERRAYDLNNLAGTSAQTFNDINALIRGTFNTNRAYDQPSASSGGLAAQTTMAEEMAVPQQGVGDASYQPTPYPAEIDIQDDTAQPFTGTGSEGMDAGKGGMTRADADAAVGEAEQLATAPSVNSQVAEQLGTFARNVTESGELAQGDDPDEDEVDLLGAYMDFTRDPDVRAVAGFDDATTQTGTLGGAGGMGEGEGMTVSQEDDEMERLPPREARGEARRRIAEMGARKEIGGVSGRRRRRR